MVNTLRRKMFKMGGVANTHGVGLTSGLSFNQGGRVGLVEGGTPLKDIFKKMGKGADALKKVPARSIPTAFLKGLGYLTDFAIPGSLFSNVDMLVGIFE